jgi:hypothetical protein
MTTKTINVDDPRLGIRDEADMQNPAFAPLIRMNVCKRLPDGSLLRLYRAFLSAPYVVQHIRNPGVLDRRRRKESREQREKLLETMDRGAAVEFYNSYFVPC